MGKTDWRIKDRYNRKAYVRFSLQIRREIGEPFKALCDRQGLSYQKVLSDYMMEYLRFWNDLPIHDRSDLNND